MKMRIHSSPKQPDTNSVVVRAHCLLVGLAHSVCNFMGLSCDILELS